MNNLKQFTVGTALSGVLNTLHDDPVAYVNYGIDTLTQDLTTGKGHFVTLAAKTGCGKSVIGLQFAESFARHNLNTAYISLEMSAQALAQRLLARAGTMAAIRHRDAVSSQMDAMRAAAEDIKKLPLVLIEAYGCTVDDIDQYIKDHSYVNVIVIDYLQLMGGRQATAYERSTAISKALATIARETGVTIVALAQLNLKGEAAQGEPGLGCVQGTTQYEQDADAVLMMWRENESEADSRRILKIVKNRHGPAGRCIYLDFDGNRMLLTPSADQTRPTKASNRKWDVNSFKANKTKQDTVDQELGDIIG